MYFPPLKRHECDKAVICSNNTPPNKDYGGMRFWRVPGAPGDMPTSGAPGALRATKAQELLVGMATESPVL